MLICPSPESWVLICVLLLSVNMSPSPECYYVSFSWVLICPSPESWELICLPLLSVNMSLSWVLSVNMCPSPECWYVPLLSPESVHGCCVPLLTFPTSQMTFNRFVKHPKSCISWFNLLDLQQFIGVLSTSRCGRTLIVAHLQFIHISANPPTNQPGSSKWILSFCQIYISNKSGHDNRWVWCWLANSQKS